MLDGGAKFKESKQNSEAPESKSSTLDKLQNGLEKVASKVAEMFSDDYEEVSTAETAETTENSEISEGQEANDGKNQEDSSASFKELFERLFSDDFLDGLKQPQENSKNDNSDDTNDISDELCDDNRKQYRNVDGGWIPNNTYVLDEVTYKTDDNGNIYSIDGKLQPNTTYELNGNIYTTDENGRIISCEANPVRSPENPRDNEAQRQAGGEDRRPNDQGGHIVSRDLNGDGGIGNLVAMDSKINQSDYKRMENDIKAALDEGKEVTTKTEITYSGDSERPDKITVTVTADGKDTVYKFDNNLDGSLRDEVPENGKETVQDRLDETSGEITSIKEEHDESGNLVETTVYITYKGEDGTNYRTSVVIDNQ